MRVFKGLLRLCAGFGIVLLLASYGGALHPIGDSLAVFRLWIAVAVALAGLLLLMTRDWWGGAYFLVLAAVAGATPAAALFQSEPVASQNAAFTFYQRNLLFLARDAAAIREEIADRAPDFITLQEVSAANRAEIFDQLPDGYDRALCRFAGVGAVAVASRHPIAEGRVLCLEGSGMIAAPVATPAGEVWLVSIHLHWPWPFGQAAQLDQLLPLIGRMDGPVLIGGDFNMVRWSNVMRRVEAASGARLIRQGQPTFHMTFDNWRSPGLEIDHVLVPGNGAEAVERLEFLGSDHRGLLVRFGL